MFGPVLAGTMPDTPSVCLVLFWLRPCQVGFKNPPMNLNIIKKIRVLLFFKMASVKSNFVFLTKIS